MSQDEPSDPQRAPTQVSIFKSRPTQERLVTQEIIVSLRHIFNSTLTGSRLPLDSAVQTTPAIAYETDPWGNVDPPVSSSPLGIEAERTAASSMPSPQIETNNIESWNPMERNRVMGQDEPSEVDHTRHRRPQQCNPPQTPDMVRILKFRPTPGRLSTTVLSRCNHS